MFENKKIQNLFLNEEKVEDLYGDIILIYTNIVFFILGIGKQQRILLKRFF